MENVKKFYELLQKMDDLFLKDVTSEEADIIYSALNKHKIDMHTLKQVGFELRRQLE